jgi:hypothetical protein
MSDLAAFLAARLDEDEAAAKAAALVDAHYGGRSSWAACFGMVTDAADPDWAVVDVAPHFFSADRDPVNAHIARHDPARVLREVEAKRAILARCEYVRAAFRDPASGLWQRTHADANLRHLAAVYSDHPDYDPAWA